MQVKFGVSRAVTDLDGFEQYAQLVERLGLDLLGIGDSQNRWTDCYSTLSLAAAATHQMRVGTFVTNPITRHPAASACGIATVQQLARGRAFFGIGNGETSIRDLGATPAPLDDLERYALAVQALCAGETAEFEGHTLRMLWDTPSVPVWIAGDGPAMLELAGRSADGVIVGNGATPELVRYALGHIQKGAREAGRAISDLEVWWMTRVLLAPSEEAGFESLRFYLASYANTRYRTAATRKGIPVPPDILERLTAMRGEFRYEESLRPDLGFNADLVDKYGLREWLGRQFAITGEPDHCIERLRQLHAAGARNIVMPQMLPDASEQTTALVEQVVSAFR